MTVEDNDTDPLDSVTDPADDATTAVADKPYEPPTEEEFKKFQATQARLLSESKKYKEAARTAKAELAAKSDQVDKLPDPAVADKRFKRSEAKAALLAAGASADKIERILRLVNFDALDIEDDEVLGLDGEVDSVKAEFPELFTPTAPVRKARPGSADQGAGTGKPARQELSLGERIMAGSPWTPGKSGR